MTPDPVVSILDIASTEDAFAAITLGGSVIAWGDADHGGTGVPARVSTLPARGERVVAIASNLAAFVALQETSFLLEAQLQVVQETDDKLALRVDDEEDDTTYFFVDQEGRVRVHTSVYDEATETSVVNGTTRLRGDVFLNNGDVALSTQLSQMVSHLQQNTLTQLGKIRLHWEDDRWQSTEGWLSKSVTLHRPVASGTEVVTLTVRDLHKQQNPSPSPYVWRAETITNIVGGGQEQVVGFTVRVMMGANVVLLAEGQTEVAQVHWMVTGTAVY